MYFLYGGLARIRYLLERLEEDHVWRKRGSVGVRRPEPAEWICVERGRFVDVIRISAEIRGTFQEAESDWTVKVARGKRNGKQGRIVETKPLNCTLRLGSYTACLNSRDSVGVKLHVRDFALRRNWHSRERNSKWLPSKHSTLHRVYSPLRHTPRRAVIYGVGSGIQNVFPHEVYKPLCHTLSSGLA